MNAYPVRNTVLDTLRQAMIAALMLGYAGLAHGAPEDPPCGRGGCSSRYIDPAVIHEAVRLAVRTEREAASHERPGAGAASLPLTAQGNASRAWDRRLGDQGKREEYDCALSFGVGGTLGSERFLATRLLGRTQVWRDQ